LAGAHDDDETSDETRDCEQIQPAFEKRRPADFVDEDPGEQQHDRTRQKRDELGSPRVTCHLSHRPLQGRRDDADTCRSGRSDIRVQKPDRHRLSADRLVAVYGSSLVCRVPLLGFMKVRTAVTLDPPHRIDRVVEGVAVRTKKAPAPLAVRVGVHDPEGALLPFSTAAERYSVAPSGPVRSSIPATSRRRAKRSRSDRSDGGGDGAGLSGTAGPASSTRYDTVLPVWVKATGVRLLHYSDIENAHDDPDRIGRLAGTIGSLRDDRTLVCGTGDNVAPGVLPLVSKGKIALEFFDAVSPAVETFGNHDFDFGPDRTEEIVRRSPQRWLSANVRRHGGPFAGVDPWWIARTDGDSVGFFGLTDPTTPPAGDGGDKIEFRDPIPAAREAVDALRDRGVDHVVALSHLGRRDDRLAAACDIDVVLGGHVHSERVERTAGTVLTRPGSGGETLLEIDLPTREVVRHEVSEGPLDAGLAARYRERLSEAGLDDAVGCVSEPIERTDAEAFRGESRVGNFVADAYRWAAERAVGSESPVVGLQNSGGIRTGPPLSGTITAADLVGLVPFDEPLVVAELSGRELRSVFAEGADTTGFGESDWWHAHLSGARVTYDHHDDRLREATVGGGPVVDSATYRLAVSEFLLHTDVEFPTLTGDHAVERLDTQYEILIAYADTVGIDPSVEGRIVRNGA